jgi:hypothetical protein
MRALKFAAILFFVPVLWAQTTLRFAHAPALAGMQEIATSLRSVVRIQKLSMGAQTGTFSVDGTPGQISMAEWLTHEFDRTTPGQTANFSVPGGGDDILSVFYVRNAGAPLGLQEIVTTLRTVCNTQSIYSYSALGAIVLRGTAAETAVDAWVIQHMDAPPDNRAGSPQDYLNPGAAGDLTRVVYLPQPIDRDSLNQLVTAIRTTGQVTHVFCGTALNTIAMRGTSDEILLAQRLIDGWTKP